MANNILKQALIEAAERDSKEIPSDEEIKKTHEFSDDFKTKILNMQNMEKKQKKIRHNWHKTFIKFAVPAIFIIGVVCFPIITNVVNNFGLNNDNGNWFSIIAYAADENSVEISKDMKVKLPSGTWRISRDENIGSDWRSGANGGGFIFEGDNIKSVRYESKNGAFIDTYFFMYASMEEINERINESGFYTNPVYLEIDDILNSKNIIWSPKKLIESEFTGNYQEYLTDTITFIVTFEDGKQITQIVEMSIDEITGEVYAQIIN